MPRWLSRNYVGECSETCEKLLGKVLSKLVLYKVITPDTADRSKSQYSKFVTTVFKENKPEFLNYSKTDQRLEEFMMKFIGASTKFSELWKLVKILLILSHGQAQVDRGFSVNRNLLVENQHSNFNCSTYHPRSHGVSWTWIKWFNHNGKIVKPC